MRTRGVYTGTLSAHATQESQSMLQTQAVCAKLAALDSIRFVTTKRRV